MVHYMTKLIKYVRLTQTENMHKSMIMKLYDKKIREIFAMQTIKVIKSRMVHREPESSKYCYQFLYNIKKILL